MSTTLKSKKQCESSEKTLDYLSNISGKKTRYIKDLFSLFEVTTGFKAHQNLINEILGICEHHYNVRIFSSLEIYQKLLSDFNPFSDIDLERAAPQGKWDNPVRHVSTRPIAALILMDKQYKDVQFSPVYVLTLLIIFAIYSNVEKSPRRLKHIVNAANEIRSLVESDNPIKLLANFHAHIRNIFHIHELIELIKHDQSIRSNPKANSIFVAITKILPLVPTTGTVHFKVSKSSPLQDTDDVTNTFLLPPIIFSAENSFLDEPEDKSIVFITDSTNDIHNIDGEEVAQDIIDNLPSSDLDELITSLSDTKLNTELRQSTRYPTSYLDNDFSKYSRNLHNPIERYWLCSALKEPEKFGADNITALCIGLSICTSINYLDLFDQAIDKNGLITPDGFFRRHIPDISSAIKPNDKTKKLFTEHINDQINPYVYLPLPDIIKEQINKIPKKKREDSKIIRDLFITKNIEPAQRIKNFIQEINKEYGQRFNTNRIACQLKQYIKSIENDPCITYALFGSSDQKAPTAFYYRSIFLRRLISTYESLSKQYFDDK